jgi:hypothetical protein
MDKTINLDFHFSKSNKETASFSENFLQDLRKCLNRFKVDVSLSEKSTSASDHFVFAFLSVKDNDDKQFINEVTVLADSQNTILINIDPFKSNDKGFPFHKFKIFRFWEEVKETGEIRFFRRNSSENNALYWERITDIAIEIVDKNSEKKVAKKGKIYLAQTDNAQSSDRDNLYRDLTEMGYEILPDRLLSSDYKECTEQINQHLKGCSLIIHPIPLIYTKYFSDKQISLVEHQCLLSSQYAANKQQEAKRIIWIPSDFDITDEENQIFVEKIQRDQNQTHNTLVLKVTLEELKKIYRRILLGEDLRSSHDNLPEVYVVADNDSEKVGEKLFSSSSKTGVAVCRNFKGITYNQHLKFLANSQIVVINYTTENEPWFTMKVNDIFKSKGMDSSKPFKKVILVKESKDLNTSAFESRFSEVHVCSLEDLKLNLAVNNN